MGTPEELYEARTFVAENGAYGRRGMPYRLLFPADLAVGFGARSWPLVVFLHGAGERGEDNRAQLTYLPSLLCSPEHRGRYPSFVVAPQCPSGRTWSGGTLEDLLRSQPDVPAEEPAAVLGIVVRLIRELPIDAGRVYLTGISMGGFGTWHLAALDPSRWAAVVPICGGGDQRTAARLVQLPIWAFHGTRDLLVPPELSRSMVAAVQAAGGRPRYTEFPDAEHDSWTPAYGHPQLLPWMFAQRRVAADR